MLSTIYKNTKWPSTLSTIYWINDTAFRTLTIVSRLWSTFDRRKATQAILEHRVMARRNRAEVVVEDEVGVYHCIQRVVRRAFLCGVDRLSGNSYDHRRNWIRDRLEFLAGLFGVEIAAFAVLSNHVHVILRNRPDVVAVVVQ